MLVVVERIIFLLLDSAPCARNEAKKLIINATRKINVTRLRTVISFQLDAMIRPDSVASYPPIASTRVRNSRDPMMPRRICIG
ncbi:MAG: hypothetical protein ACM3TN_13710 [Alphaproteobacteria bacterium]